ncbi:hypothetical protein [Paenibacillus sp. MMS20-IR301]|uniref:hypothetical protein n=1 Tax=Paenibacillus sp. MMS20-IR301 TaxID=2895946 RepID=UPI0028EA9FB4|nr:hypothetical protein [Paenibacillus sp. MMS20-IR301]WNS43291.1 hypothetical protein LOS79_30870 [Paenibacillus sp. MMS20-IR301]
MDSELKGKILNNTFIDKVRNEMVVDEVEFEALRELLIELSKELKAEQVVNKELALVLYSMPQMIRNTFLSFTAHDVQDSELLNKLEDIWMELDELVIECLS